MELPEDDASLRRYGLDSAMSSREKLERLAVLASEGPNGGAGQMLGLANEDGQPRVRVVLNDGGHARLSNN